MIFTPFTLKGRPEQTAEQLNEMLERLERMRSSIILKSKDDNVIMILGNQPTNPATGKPYSFGIHTYRRLGDRLEEI